MPNSDSTLRVLTKPGEEEAGEKGAEGGIWSRTGLTTSMEPKGSLSDANLARHLSPGRPGPRAAGEYQGSKEESVRDMQMPEGSVGRSAGRSVRAGVVVSATGMVAYPPPFFFPWLIIVR